MPTNRITTTLILLLISTTSAFAAQLPRLVDVGADKCIPCIKMEPVLEQLKTEFNEQLQVEFVDAWKKRQQAASYGVRMIPTQIFFDTNGKELYRHTGFISRSDIVAKWLELGYPLKEGEK